MDTPVATSSQASLIIDLDALRDNYRLMAARSGAAATGAAVKADAYGLGLARIAPVLAKAGCTSFFCANATEGVQARRLLGGDAEIFILDGVCAGSAKLLCEEDLTPVLSTYGQIALWRQAGSSRPAALHVDTGLNRLGLPWRDFDAHALGGAKLTLVMSHLACASAPKHALNALQLQRFRAIAAAFPGIRASLASSAGIMHGADFHFDLTRPGIALYGGAPLDAGGPALKPVARIEAPVLQVRALQKGDSAGYGADFVAPADMRVATLALGYADGLPRSAFPDGFARFAGQRAAIAGRVSMDFSTFDISGLDPAPRPGDRVALLGDDLEALAKAARTVSYELLTGLGHRFERDYRGSSA